MKALLLTAAVSLAVLVVVTNTVGLDRLKLK
jgi:hypothetical protein